MQLSTAQLEWIRLRNEEAARTLKAKLVNLVDREACIRQVRAANATVRNTVLAVIERADLSPESRVRLRHKLIEVLNQLAFEQQYKGE